MNTEEFNQLIATRRSTWPLQFEASAKIPDSIIEQMLENANWAPNHGNTEPWRFTVFTGEGLKKLADFQAEIYRKHTPVEKFTQKKFDKLSSFPLLASHVIAIVMKRGNNPKIPELEEMLAVACAVQNMYLTAAAYQVGAYWSTGGVTFNRSKEVLDFFDLGSEDKLLGFFYVGKIKKPTPKGRRKPIEDKVEWVR
ncbi:MAG: nitroreductase [Chitinophagales bacterium]